MGERLSYQILEDYALQERAAEILPPIIMLETSYGEAWNAARVIEKSVLIVSSLSIQGGH